jgi:antitoxin Phd
MRHWQLQEAKAKLSHLIHLSTTSGPQGISVRGKEKVVLLSKRTYDNMFGKKPNFVTFLANSPLQGLSLDIERDKSLPRETIDL